MDMATVTTIALCIVYVAITLALFLEGCLEERCLPPLKRKGPRAVLKSAVIRPAAVVYSVALCACMSFEWLYKLIVRESRF